MRTQLVYDLPTRIFHWLFAGLFITAFMIAKLIDDDSPSYSYHMLAGLMLSFTVTLRLIWGFIGTKYARFSSFALHPSDLIQYFSEVLTGGKRRWPGHNPASSWAALVMMALALGLGVTGLLMTTGAKESFEDIHELFANLFLVVVIAHVAGVILHGLRQRDGIAFSMMDGQKVPTAESDSISNSRPLVALIFLALVILFATYLSRNYTAQTRTLNLFGTSLNLGENEKEEEGDEEGQEKEGEEQGQKPGQEPGQEKVQGQQGNHHEEENESDDD